MHGWPGLTVAVAWTLLASGVKVRPDVLGAARQHAILHLAPSTPLPQAEDRAAWLTRAFIAQARGRPLADPWPADAEMPLTDRWVRAVDGIRDRTTQAVFRSHYGDHRSLAHVETQLGLDRVAVEAARAGLREVLRGVARSDGVPLDTWPAERLDRMLARLAAWAPDACPPMWDVVNGAHRDHVRRCIRCNRMVRLIHKGILETADLQAPTLKARTTGTATVLALQLHPDARPHRARLVEVLATRAHAVGEDLLLVDASDPDPVRAALTLAAEVGLPPRQQMRGALATGPGEWSTYGPLGPVGATATREVRARSWGAVDGVGPLPDPLPEPPGAWTAWLAVGGLAVVAGLLVWLASASSAHAAPVRVQFVPDAQGSTWVWFDAPEPTRVHLFAAPAGRPQAVLRSDSAADKASLATGDGSYRTLVPSTEVLLVATDAALDLDKLLGDERLGEATDPGASPLPALARAIVRMDPRAQVFAHGR